MVDVLIDFMLLSCYRYLGIKPALQACAPEAAAAASQAAEQQQRDASEGGDGNDDPVGAMDAATTADTEEDTAADGSTAKGRTEGKGGKAAEDDDAAKVLEAERIEEMLAAVIRTLHEAELCAPPGMAAMALGLGCLAPPEPSADKPAKLAILLHVAPPALHAMLVLLVPRLVDPAEHQAIATSLLIRLQHESALEAATDAAEASHDATAAPAEHSEDATARVKRIVAAGAAAACPSCPARPAACPMALAPPLGGPLLVALSLLALDESQTATVLHEALQLLPELAVDLPPVAQFVLKVASEEVIRTQVVPCLREALSAGRTTLLAVTDVVRSAVQLRPAVATALLRTLGDTADAAAAARAASDDEEGGRVAGTASAAAATTTARAATARAAAEAKPEQPTGLRGEPAPKRMKSEASRELGAESDASMKGVTGASVVGETEEAIKGDADDAQAAAWGAVARAAESELKELDAELLLELVVLPSTRADAVQVHHSMGGGMNCIAFPCRAGLRPTFFSCLVDRKQRRKLEKKTSWRSSCPHVCYLVRSEGKETGYVCVAQRWWSVGWRTVRGLGRCWTRPSTCAISTTATPTP